MKHDLESLLEQISRIITFSPPRTRSKPPSLEAFYSFHSILTQQILYTIFHNFVYLLLTNGTPFTYLAYNIVSVLTAGNPHCHKIGISHKYRTLSRRVRGWTSGRSLPVQIFVDYFSGISGGASPYRPSNWEYPSPGHSRK